MTMMMKMVAPSNDQLKMRGNDMLSFSKFLWTLLVCFSFGT
jgi:hypothetical protein